MKTQIHPKWFDNAEVKCACGNSFTTGATFESLHVDVCYNCHPFYTGQMKFVDTAGRVDAFLSKRSKQVDKRLTKTQKRRLKHERKIQKELERPDTLEALRKQISKRKN